MSDRHEVRSFDYVNHPYERVRAQLSEDPEGVFRAATRAAASRVHSLAAELRVNIGGIDLGAEIDITVEDIDEVDHGPTARPATRIQLEWKASKRPRLFPVMKGVLSVYPLTSTETQLDFSGRYEPPLGPLGEALDAVALHRVAEASVDRFVKDVTHHLRGTVSGD